MLWVYDSIFFIPCMHASLCATCVYVCGLHNVVVFMCDCMFYSSLSVVSVSWTNKNTYIMLLSGMFLVLYCVSTVTIVSALVHVF
jgi:hypothetical protein